MSRLTATVFIIFLAAATQAQTPHSVKDFNERASERYARGDFDGAIADFTRVIEMTSRPWVKEDPRRNNWAPAAEQVGAAEGDRAMVLDPRAATAYVNRGIVRLARGDADGAVSDFDRALVIAPGFVSAYYGRGTAWIYKGDAGRAFADFDKSLRLDPRFVEGYTGRGNARLDAGDRAGAIKVLRR